jgi:phosphatidylinositol N-acetylglucosaminyltransferase subunit P
MANSQQATPAPTPSRSIYGFVVCLLFITLFVLYVLWAFIPSSIFENYLGITELPNKYFALFVPILVLTATTLFAFLIYPSMSFIMTSDLDSINTITDSYSIRRCQHRDANGILCDNKIPKQPFTSWIKPTECDNHQNRETRISDFCDCTDKSKCMLATDPEYIERLRRKPKQMRNSADLDIFDVNEILYGGK